MQPGGGHDSNVVLLLYCSASPGRKTFQALLYYLQPNSSDRGLCGCYSSTHDFRDIHAYDITYI